MAKRGPKPKPTPLKIATGTRKDRIPTSEPIQLPGAPEIPAYLDKVAKAEWARMVALLSQLGLLSAAHGPALGLYCQSFSRLTKAEAEIAKNGETVTTARGGLQTSPYLRIARDASRQMQSLLVEFGLTPSASSRVSATRGEAPQDDLEDFITSKSGS